MKVVNKEFSVVHGGQSPALDRLHLIAPFPTRLARKPFSIAATVVLDLGAFLLIAFHGLWIGRYGV